MTNEEAIAIITEAIEDYVCNHVTDTAKAQKMLNAIQTLEQEPCEDAISRQAVLSYIYNDLGLGDEENGADIERQMELESSYRYVKSLPPVTLQPKTGHWKIANSFCTCDQCGYKTRPWNNTLFCPNCGAKMVEPQEGANE